MTATTTRAARVTDTDVIDPRAVLALLDSRATSEDGEDVLREVLAGMAREEELIAARERRRHLAALMMPAATSPVYSRLGRLR